MDMNQICENATEFLSSLVNDLGFDLNVTSKWTDEGCIIDLSGADAHFALAENGELLDAFEVLLFQIYGREIDREHRFIVDAEGFRQSRKSELQAMARFAADQVRKNGRPVHIRRTQLDRTSYHPHDTAARRRPFHRISRRRSRPASAGPSAIRQETSLRLITQQ